MGLDALNRTKLDGKRLNNFLTSSHEGCSSRVDDAVLGPLLASESAGYQRLRLCPLVDPRMGDFRGYVAYVPNLGQHNLLDETAYAVF